MFYMYIRSKKILTGLFYICRKSFLSWTTKFMSVSRTEIACLNHETTGAAMPPAATSVLLHFRLTEHFSYEMSCICALFIYKLIHYILKHVHNLKHLESQYWSNNSYDQKSKNKILKLYFSFYIKLNVKKSLYL